VLVALVILPSVSQGADGPSRHIFSDWQGPDIPVWTYVPSGAKATNAAIVIVMHGVNRDADRYRDQWTSVADKYGFVVLAPEFSRANFPGSAGYNYGGVFESDLQTRRDFDTSAFAAIDLIFDDTVRRLGSRQTGYTLYGHSAGSQFVHRYLYFVPHSKAKRYILANAGWYTLPTFDEAYPYGLAGSGLPEANLLAAMERDVVVLLGDQDTSEQDPNLRRTPEAMRQGPHRYARGHAYFRTIEEIAKATGRRHQWRLQIVTGVGHNNAQMAVVAATLVE
jgi:hypothetical protein